MSKEGSLPVQGICQCVYHQGVYTESLGIKRSYFQKNLGRLWLAYTEFRANSTCYSSFLLTLGTLIEGFY